MFNSPIWDLTVVFSTACLGRGEDDMWISAGGGARVLCLFSFVVNYDWINEASCGKMRI